MLRIPRVRPLPAPAGRRSWIALRDRPYVAITSLNGVMYVHGMVLTYALPLWIVEHTTAPRWMVSSLVVLNTALVVVAQVRASRGVDNAVAAGRAMRRAGVAFFIGVGLMGLATGVSRPLAVAFLFVGVAIYTAGEIWQSAGSSELMYGMAPPALQGQYVGVFTLGQGTANAVAPAIVGLACLGLGRLGWLLVATALLLAGLAAPLVVGWARRAAGRAAVTG
jgi:dipeptide/tripeptide permease